MANYFYDMLPAEESARVEYVPDLTAFLEKIRRDFAERPALSDMQNTYSYSLLYDRIAHRRAFINGLGLPKGARIAVWDRNSIDAMELFMAVTTAGYAVLMLPATLAQPQMAGSVKKFGISAIFVRDEFKPMTAELTIPVLAASATSEDSAPAANVKKDDLAAIFFTGGTTGMPKGVMLSHGNLTRGAMNGAFIPDSTFCGHRYIAFLPLSHIFGAIRGFLSALYTGATVYSCEDMKRGIGTIPMIKPTLLVLVPGLCEILLGVVKMNGVGFLGGALRLIIAGAANVPPLLIAEYKKLGIRLLGGYGLTEGSNLTTGNADVETHPDSIGKVYPGQEYKFVNGELWLKGDNVMLGYYGDPEATAAVMEDGWLKTGDLVHEDRDGFLYVDGRIKNIIVLKSGENISPEDIENKFYLDPMVRDCLVRSVTVNGEEVLGIEILPRMEVFGPDATPEAVGEKLQELVKRINAELPPFARIINMKVRTEDFKRTGSLKVDRLHS